MHLNSSVWRALVVFAIYCEDILIRGTPRLASKIGVTATLNEFLAGGRALLRDGMQGANRSHSRSYGEDLQRRRPPEPQMHAAR